MVSGPDYRRKRHALMDMNCGSLFALTIWLITLFFLSIVDTPSIKIGPEVPIDKIFHFVLYGVTAILFFSVLKRRLKVKSGIIFSILLSSFYGFMFEIVQSFVSYRCFELSDILANTAGATAFTMINYFRQ